jgi:hypothetical protein
VDVSAAELSPDLADSERSASLPADVGRALERASAVFVAFVTALIVAAVAVHEARTYGASRLSSAAATSPHVLMSPAPGPSCIGERRGRVASQCATPGPAHVALGNLESSGASGRFEPAIRLFGVQDER